MRETPLVIIAYNRPDKVSRLIFELEKIKPSNIIFAVDGAKKHVAGDDVRVSEVQNLVNKFTWTDKVETRFRDENLGLKNAVIDVVSHAISQYGPAMILEEDTLPGPNFIPFAQNMLERFAKEPVIEHISGYNVVPETIQGLSGRDIRLTRYPESIAWATWERAWKNFDGSLDWGLNASTQDISRIVGSKIGALKWKQNFHDAQSGRISTWAYRWISSMWSRNSFVVSPNKNLVTYGGFDEGTNSFLKAAWQELPRYDGPMIDVPSTLCEFDERADKWTGNKVFSENMYGLTRGVAISAVLELRKNWREHKKTKTKFAT